MPVRATDAVPRGVQAGRAHVRYLATAIPGISRMRNGLHGRSRFDAIPVTIVLLFLPFSLLLLCLSLPLPLAL